ncbi:MAG: hypothetical protein LBJ00_05625 [Planctomycetaceae bacterium]|nr:hypothetical protein [Planctomycetaceae bacterium]
MNNRFTLLRLPNALRCRFTAASGISKQPEYICGYYEIPLAFLALKL